MNFINIIQDMGLFDWVSLIALIGVVILVVIEFRASMPPAKENSLEKIAERYNKLQTFFIGFISVCVLIFLILYPVTIFNYTFKKNENGNSGSLEQFVQIVFTFIALIGATVGFFVRQLGDEFKNVPDMIDKAKKDIKKIQEDAQNQLNSESTSKITQFQEDINNSITKALNSDRIKNIIDDHLKELANIASTLEREAIDDIRKELIDRNTNKSEHKALQSNIEQFKTFRETIRSANTIELNHIETLERLFSEIRDIYSDSVEGSDPKFTALLYLFKTFSLYGLIKDKKMTSKKDSEFRNRCKDFITKNTLTTEYFSEFSKYSSRGRRLDDNEKSNINTALDWAKCEKINFN